MTILHKLGLSALALTLVPALALAEPPVKQWAENRVQSGLMKPLAKKDDERSKFSRVVQPPRERRLRVLSSSLARDEQGRGFASYVVESRYGDDWRADFPGCVYKKTGHIYIKLGDEYRPAEILFGKDVKPVSGVCEPKASGDRS